MASMAFFIAPRFFGPPKRRTMDLSRVAVHRFRTGHAGFGLRFGVFGELGHDRGLCLRNLTCSSQCPTSLILRGVLAVIIGIVAIA
jgi:hypothetical protein